MDPQEMNTEPDQPLNTETSPSSQSTTTPSSEPLTQPEQTTQSKPSTEPQAAGESLESQLTKAFVKEEPAAQGQPGQPGQPGQESPVEQDPAANRYAIPSSSAFKLPGGHELRKAFVEKVEMLKQADATTQQLSNMVSSFRERVSEIGASPEQVTASFGYLAAVNKGDYESALKMLDSERAAIAKKAGLKLPGVEYDPLSEFPDLQDKVDSLQMDEEAALEMAKVRLEKRKREEADQVRTQQTERTQQAFQLRERSHNEMMSWLQQVAAQDIDYPDLDDAVAEFIESTDFLANTPPQFWTRNLKAHYNSLKAGLAKLNRNRTGANPMRPRTPEGGGAAAVQQQEPASLGEALSNAFLRKA